MSAFLYFFGNINFVFAETVFVTNGSTQIGTFPTGPYIANTSWRINTSTLNAATISAITANFVGPSNATLSDATGWTSLISSSVDDSYVQVPFGFNNSFNNTNYSSVYVGSNTYLTFGNGSGIRSVTISSPPYPAVHMCAADNSYQKVLYKLDDANTMRVRYEGKNATSGVVGSPNIVYEAVFYKDQSYFDLFMGVNARCQTPFTVNLSSTSIDPVSVNGTIAVTATFSQPVADFVLDDITVSNGTAGSFSGSGTTYTFIVTPTTDGLVTINVASGVATSTTTSLTNLASNELSRTYNSNYSGPPTVILSSSATENVLSPFSVTATFSESVTNFALGDITVINGTAGSFSGSGTTYTFVITPITYGLVLINIGAGVAFDVYGNGNLEAVGDYEIPAIGSPFQGGKLAYILQPGDPGYVNDGKSRGFVAASSDQSTGIRWYNGVDTTTGATDTGLGTGFTNTNKIIASQGSVTTSYAAGLARAYNGGGYTDWYLPSKDELNKLYLNKTAIGGFTTYGYYWSSSDYNSDNRFAYSQYFSNGSQSYPWKDSARYVRAVRNIYGLSRNYIPNNQDSVFAADAFKKSNASVSIVSSGDATNNIWFAPSGTTVFSAGATMTTASGTATSILAPATPGSYKLFVVSSSGISSFGSAATLIVDDTPPTVVLTSTAASNVTAPFSVTATFSEATNNFDVGDISVTNGIAGSLSGSGTEYTFIISPSGSGIVTVNIGSAGVTDLAGNNLIATTVDTIPTIGSSFEGGKVAYFYQSGDVGYVAGQYGGLIAASSDQSTGIRWYNGVNTTTGATDTGLGTGFTNTNKIIASQGSVATSYAAGLARAYNGGGYNDWYLPSKDELYKLYLNRTAIGSFSTYASYWSSSEYDYRFANIQYFSDGSQSYTWKDRTPYVRAVRSLAVSLSLSRTYTSSGPTNQDTVFSSSISKIGGASVSVVSSGDATNNIWFAPLGTTVFSAGSTMTTAGGTATSILAPATAGTYKLFVVNSAGVASAASAATLTVDNTAPTISTLSPVDNTTGVGTTDNLVITFSEAVNVGSGNIIIKKTSDNTTFETILITDAKVTGNGTNTITINPAGTFASGVEYYVLIDATAIDDLVGNSFAGISSTTAWSFTSATTVITSGNYTLKTTGGDYSTWAAFWNSLGNLTGNINLVVDASLFTETVAPDSVTENLNGYTIHVYPVTYPSTTDGTTGARITTNYNARFLDLQVEGPGEVIIEGLSMINTYGSGNTSAYGLDIRNISTSPTITFRRNFIKGFYTGTSYGANTPIFKYYNNIVTAAGYGININYSLATNSFISNNTLAGVTAHGFNFSAITVSGLFENNLAHQSMIHSFTNPDGATGNNNSSYDDTADNFLTGVNNRISKTASPFTNLATGNLSLATGSDPIGNGKDLSSLFTTDYFGNTRTGAWDIGAVDFVSLAPTNQDTVFSSSISKTGGGSVSVASSGEATNNIWFAPSGTTVFSAGPTMTTAGGIATSILAPATAGTYKLFVINSAGVASAASAATLTVDNTAPTVALTSAAALTVNGPFSVTATFSESTSNFILGDISVTNGTAGTFSGSGTTYTFTVTPISNGLVTVNINGGVASDGAGNNNLPASGDTTPTAPSIGDAYQGGRVAYILQAGDPGYLPGQLRGLISASADQTTMGSSWIEGGNTPTTLNGKTFNTLGAGQTNTNAMKAQIGFTGGAAKVADDYTNTNTGTGVYSDWYLPSQDELNKLYVNKMAIGGFDSDEYWSSSEIPTPFEGNYIFASKQIFSDGTQTFSNKVGSPSINVRAVRSFTGLTRTYALAAPTNQDTVFSSSISKTGGASVSVVSSGDATNNIWFAPLGTTVFSAGPTMTTAGGTATSILAPATAGAYKLFVINSAGVVSAASVATLTVDNTAPTISTLSPVDNATGVATTDNLVVTFSEAVNVGTGNITIKKTSDNSIFESIPITDAKVTGTGTNTITINPAGTLASGVEYYVLIDATAIDDLVGNSFAGVSSTTDWSFTTIVAGSAPTGGTITIDGNYTIHTFTSSGTFVPINSGNVEVLVVAGGGGGAAMTGGGGGAGGLLYDSAHAISSQSYNVIVGNGGLGQVGSANPGNGSDGQNSSFDNLVSIGGGGAGTNSGTGRPGGSGGGAGHNNTTGGLGTTGQGHNGSGGATSAPNYGAGGGGGAGAAGGAPTNTAGGNGGVGLAYSISGSSVYYAGGGGGGTYQGGTYGLGGNGGGGNAPAGNATPNSGGGGGGQINNLANGGNGGSGIVIIRYLTSSQSSVPAPTNQDTVFSSSISKTGGTSVSVVSSGDATNNIWFAPSGTTVFSAGATMTTAGGTATSILAPATAGDYKLFVINSGGVASAASTATLTVDNTAPTVALTSAAALTVNGPFSVTATFSESTSNFILGDISVTNGTAGTFSGSGTTYTFTVTPSANGLVTVAVGGSVATDTAGNGNTAATPLSRTYDITLPTISTLSPVDNATGVGTTDNLVITFSEAVNVGSGNITIKKTSDNSIFESIPITDAKVTGNGTNTITINPAGTLASGVEYYVLIDVTAIDDLVGNSFAGVSSTTEWSFTTSSPATLSGSLYNNIGGSKITTAKTINVSVNGAAATTAESSNGDFTVTLSQALSANNIVTVYVDGEIEKASTITKVSASGNLTGIDLFQNFTTIRHEGTITSITNSDLATADNLADADILFNVDGSSVATFSNGLSILVGKTYNPGNNINLSGSWNNAGTFTSGSGTVTFTGTSIGQTINPGSSGGNFYNLTFNGPGGAWSPSTNSLTIQNDLTMTAGTFDTSNGVADVVVNGNVSGTGGVINMTTGNTFTQSVATNKNFGGTSGSADWTFNNLILTSSSGSPTITTSSGNSGKILIKSVMTIGSNTTLNAGSKTYELNGSSTPFVKNGTLVAGTSTFNYTSTANTNITSGNYYHLGLIDPWDIIHEWDTGDINLRVTGPSITFDKDHDGTPSIIAPVQHGVKAFDKDGNLEWTYTGITNGYDVRDLAVGDLNGTGYNDSLVIASGYYTTATDGKLAILDKDGIQLQKITGANFATANVSTIQSVAIDGTDIYVGHSLGVTKFVKSGANWVEDAALWNKTTPTSAYDIQIADVGNGKRIFVASRGTNKLYAYQTNGTLDWSTTIGTYFGIFRIGKTDSTKTGNQIICPYQNGTVVVDKDGNIISNVMSTGTNVRASVTLYDNDGDGEDEIYVTDMGDDVYVWERTATNTYSVKYNLLNYSASGQYGGITSYDIDEDSDNEIFLMTKDGNLFIYDKTLTTLKKTLNIGHGIVGGMVYEGYMNEVNGTSFVDTSADGHADLVISGGTGYVDVFETSGFTPGGPVYTLLPGTFNISGNLTIGNGTDLMSVNANTNNPAIAVSGNLSIMANATFTGSNTASLNVGGSWNNAGTFTPGLGSVTFDGVNTATISGSNTFNNLIFNTASGAKQVNFAAGSTQTIGPGGTLQFYASVGKVLTLRSTASPTKYNFAIPGNITSGVNYLNVMDNAVSGGTITYEATTVVTASTGWISSDVTAPTISTLSPVDNATGVGTTDNLVITFSEAVNVGSGNIIIKKTSDNTTFETIPITDAKVTGNGTNTITINPSGTLASGVEYYVLIDVTAIDDLVGNSFAGVSSTTDWSFTAAPAATSAVTYVSSGSANGSGSVILSAANILDGDILVAFVASGKNGGEPFPETITGPAGWTVLAENLNTLKRFAVFWKRASGESGNYTFQSNYGSVMIGSIGVYRGGVSTGSPIDVLSNTPYIVNDTTVRAASITPTVSNGMFVYGGYHFLIASLTPPTGMNSRQTIIGSASIGSLNLSDLAYSTTSPSGNKDGTAGSATSMKHAFMIAIKPNIVTSTSLAQSSYKFFYNTNNSSISSALSAVNSSADLDNSGDNFRLRLLMHAGSEIPLASASYKLQYAEKVGACDSSFSGELYQDVTENSAIAYYNNYHPEDKATATLSPIDPSHGADPIVYQSYVESNNFTNSINTLSSGQDGLWDFSLYDKDNADNISYCLRVVKDDGTELTDYLFIPEVSTAIRRSRGGGNVHHIEPVTDPNPGQDGGTDHGGGPGTSTATFVTKSPGTVSDDGSVGTLAWTNPDRAKISDNLYASASIGNNNTHFLKSTNYGFNIPAEATIQGIEVGIEKKDYKSSAYDNVVKIIKSNGSYGSADKADLVSSWGEIDLDKNYGGENDLWGETWSPADINNSNFGVAISASGWDMIPGSTANIDHIQITVYYTVGEGSGPTDPGQGGGGQGGGQEGDLGYFKNNFNSFFIFRKYLFASVFNIYNIF